VKTQHLTINTALYQHPVFREFYEEVQRCNRVLAEARKRLLTEDQLNAQQIDQIFRLVADGAAAGKNTDSGEVDMGSNKTALGKVTGAVGDAMSKLKSKWESLKDWVSKSGPVQGFDVAFDQLQGSLLNAMGGEGGKVANAMQKYRQFAVKHPVAQGFILVALAALAGTAMGGGAAAVAGVTFGIRTIDALLKGHKFSSSVYKGAKAAAVMTVASLGINAIIDNFNPDPTPGPGPSPTPDVPPSPTPSPDVPPSPDVQPVPDLTPTDYTIRAGDTLSQLASDNGITVQDIMDANPNITNPNGMTDAGRLLQPGDTIKIPQSMDFSPPPVYAGGTGTLADTIQKMMTGQYSGDANIALNALKNDPSQLKLLSPEQAAWAKSQITKLAESARRVQWIDRDATVRTWALNESLGRTRGGVMLTEAGVNEVFRRVEEGVWDSIKKGAGAVAGAVGNAAKKGWNSATNKITYDSLGMNWRSINPNRLKGNATGMTADSRDIEVFLRRQGVKDPLIFSVYKQMGIPISTIATTQDDTDVAGQPADDKTQAQATQAAAGSTTAQAGGAGATQAGGDKVGDANDLIRDLEADQARKAAGGAAKTGTAGAGSSSQAKNPYAYDYAAAAKIAGIKPAAAKPDYSKMMPGYSSQKMTMKTPTAAKPAAAAPVTGKPGVQGAVPKTQAPAQQTASAATEKELDDFVKASDELANYAKNQQVAAEGRRMYGGKYIRESAAQRTAREFEHYLKNLG
jgi:LysM repeat protein